jgi:hypothetical protein
MDCMLHINVEKSEARVMRSGTPSLFAEFPLRISTADDDLLATLLEAARHVYKTCRGESLRYRALRREPKEEQAAGVGAKSSNPLALAMRRFRS